MTDMPIVSVENCSHIIVSIILKVKPNRSKARRQRGRVLGRALEVSSFSGSVEVPGYSPSCDKSHGLLYHVTPCH